MLQLVGKKFYVGKTNNPEFRLEQHFSSNGSQWTKQYKPLSVLEIISNCDDFDEDKYTLKYMNKYGINNVRGGSFCELKLNGDQIKVIKKMINSSTDKCYICGEAGHFGKHCPQDYDNILKELEKLLVDLCFRCFRPNHHIFDCFALTTVTGDAIDDDYSRYAKATSKGEVKRYDDDDDDSVCFRCSRPGHFVADCYAATTATGILINNDNSTDKKRKGNTNKKPFHSTNKKPRQVCYTCGREGHYSTTCFASKR